ncbi:AAA family ATPase [Kallotenue papyrolyticum]|uniref:AAA family ATPase n=1 Tax=Kallotenue papyrolyticum TaxID=1325125 RepID=UPI0004785E31|nr:AAA family ATPase [Kallotenue papyrolyticum]
MSTFSLREFTPSTSASASTGPAVLQLPPEPATLAQTGLTMGFLAELALKHIYFAGVLAGQQLAEALHLPFLGVVDEVLNFLKEEEYVDIMGAQGGFYERSFQYVITAKGREKVHEVLDRSQYAGPAPVPLQAYIEAVKRQSIGQMVIDQQTIRRAFEGLVISDKLLDQIGPAANSARSLFLYGPPGNGKTTIAEGIARIMQGQVIVPYAVEVDGQVIKVFDPLNHQPIPQPASAPAASGVLLDPLVNEAQPRVDSRWVLCRRPVVVVGGELILQQLELIFDPVAKVYEAPYQMKANGGVFLIDDFGRQQCRPQDLLNRWIVPLEKRVDYLALQTGKKLEIPFDVLIIFSTNLDPKQLVDDAFLRRIRHKIEVPNPSPAEYREIFRLVCKSKNIPYSDEGLRYLLQEHYIKVGRELRCCHPRDLCDQILDEARYRSIPPQMTKELIDRACSAYFVKL